MPYINIIMIITKKSMLQKLPRHSVLKKIVGVNRLFLFFCMPYHSEYNYSSFNRPFQHFQ